MQAKSNEAYEVRGSAASLILVQALLAVPLCIWVVVVTMKPFLVHQLSFWVPPAVILLIGSGLHLWAKSITIKVNDHSIIYMHIFSCVKSIHFDEIKDLRLVFGVAQARPTYRIEVKPKDHSLLKPFDMNVSTLRREDLDHLVVVLEERTRFLNASKGRVKRKRSPQN
jgi:hypothetical protein